MTDAEQLLHQRMRMIAEQAHRTNLERVRELDTAVHGLVAGRLDEDARQRAAQVAHKLAGSAGTFGYHRASDLARGIETALNREPVDTELVVARQAELVQALDGPPDEDIV